MFLLSVSIWAQEVTLSGAVYGSDGLLLSDANILAFPEIEGQEVKFAISDQKGRFRLKLFKDIPYSIEVSYLGYRKQLVRLKIVADTVRDFVLSPRVDELEEVVVSYKIPIQVKEDIIIYDADAFVNGQERKLREVLKKLPGIEVDREGNVTANGKKITKVMVENKDFFTGDSKLAVNNLPADAIDKIEVLDNYNEVSFLKGLQESDQMAMNVRLKKGKQKFVFGDMEAGGGVKDRYLVHPALFYYSPKMNLNFIGDVNNTGKKSFTFNDYLEFEGGFGRLMSDAKGYFDLFKDDFSKYLANTDFKENKNRFGAVNHRYSISPKTDLNSYIIANGSATESVEHTLNLYNDGGMSIVENRSTGSNLENVFIIGKITLGYEPNSKEDLSVNSFVKLSDNSSIGTLISNTDNENGILGTTGELNSVSVKQNVSYSRKFSKAQTLSAEATLSFKKNKPLTSWETNSPFLDNLIPLEEDTVFKVNQTKETKQTTIDFVLKDYWVLNNYNHVYTSLGMNLVFEDYMTNESQLLSNGDINDFSDNGFGNELSYGLNDIFLGMEYKFLAGIFTVKPGVFHHYYMWNNKQMGSVTNSSVSMVLPRLKVEAKFNTNENLMLAYNVTANFPNAPQLMNNYVLSNFNQVYRGGQDLGNEKVHTVSLGYFKFSLLRGVDINGRVSYTKKTQSVKNSTVLEGIDQFSTYAMFYRPENSFMVHFNFRKKLDAVKIGFESNGRYNEFYQIVNNETSKNISRSFMAKATIETLFKKAPNVTLGYTYEPSHFKTGVSTSKFLNNELFVNLQYDFLNAFQYKMDYSNILFQNKGQKIENTFHMANTSLYYQEEDSPWGFEISVANIFNVGYKQQSSFSDFLISDRRTFILPRIAMLKVSYKL